MKNLIISLSLVLVSIIIGCSPDEKIIDNSNIKWHILLASQTQPFILQVREMPQNTITISDIFQDVLGSPLSAQVEGIAEYRDNLFIFIPSQFKIEVLSSETFSRKATIDFSATQSRPSGICFPNATDAYICHSNDSTVSLLDMTTFTIARTISVGKNPTSISCSGNQIFVANQGSNTVSIIDSRTHKEEAVIPVPSVPTYTDISIDGKKAFVVSLGFGKIDSETKTSAVVTSIDVETRTVTAQKDIGYSNIKAIDQIPNGISVANASYAFILTQQALFRLDAKTGDRITLIEKDDILKSFYNYKRDELMILSNNGTQNILATASPTNGEHKSTFTLENYFKLVFALK